MFSLAEVLPVLVVALYVFAVLYLRPTMLIDAAGNVSPYIVAGVSVVLGLVALWLVQYLNL